MPRYGRPGNMQPIFADMQAQMEQLEKSLRGPPEMLTPRQVEEQSSDDDHLPLVR